MNHSEVSFAKIVDDETRLFCKAEQAFQASKGTLGKYYEDDTMYARDSNCGIATAVVQANLLKHHNIESERLFGVPPLAPRDKFDRKFGHVILRADAYLVDPTFGQLTHFVGVRPSIKEVQREKNIYPTRLALVVDEHSPEQSITSATNMVMDAESLSTDYYDTHESRLRMAGEATLRSVIESVYTGSHYTPLSISSQENLQARTETLLALSEEIRTSK